MNYLKKNKRIILSCLSVGLVLFLISSHPVYAAGESSAIASFLSWIFMGLISAVGKIVTLLMGILNILFSFKMNNDDVSKGIITGWTTVRDICNMFFVLILLVIAFATILRRESYSVKALLPKLIIAAVIINFSKTICWLMIDASQVIMLTFANGFTGASSNFVSFFGLEKLNQISTCPGAQVSDWSIFGATFLAFIVVVLVAIIMIMLIAILVMRIVMFWTLIILSPFAFMCSVLPQTQKYASQWWGEFGKYLVVGPVLTFFVYLSLVIMSTGSKAPAVDCTALVAGNSAMGEIANMQRFILGIALLVGAMKITSTMGVMGGNIGMNLSNKLKDKGIGGVKSMGKGALNVGKNTGKLAARTALRTGGTLIGAGAKEGSTRGKIGSFVNQWGNDLKDSRQEEKKKKRLKTLEKLGMSDKLGGSMEKLKTVAEDDKVKKAVNITKGVGIAAAGVLTGNVPLAIAGVATGIAKGASKKGIIADTLENRGKGRDLIDAEKDQEMMKTNVEENKKRETAPLEANRDWAIKATEDWRKKQIDDLGPKPRNTASDTDKKAYTDLVAGINKEADNNILDHNEDFSNEKARIDNKYKPDLDSAEARVKAEQTKQSSIGKTMESWGNNMQGPNHITIKAAEEGTKQNAEVHRTVNELGEENVKEFPKTNWYSPGGPTSKQQKMFDALSENSAAAAKAMKQMVDSLKSSKNSLKPLEMQNIQALKQLIATQKTAGKDLGKFGDLIDVLNTTNTKDKKGRMTIDDYSKNSGSSSEKED